MKDLNCGQVYSGCFSVLHITHEVTVGSDALAVNDATDLTLIGARLFDRYLFHGIFLVPWRLLYMLELVG